MIWEIYFVLLVLLTIWWISMWIEEKAKVIILLYIIRKKGLTESYLDLYEVARPVIKKKIWKYLFFPRKRR